MLWWSLYRVCVSASVLQNSSLFWWKFLLAGVTQNWYALWCFTLCSCSCLLMLISSFAAGVLDILMMYGAYSTTRRLAVIRIFFRFLWFSMASIFICFLYVYATYFLQLFSFFKRFTFHWLVFLYLLLMCISVIVCLL